jgi:hypothetical protein
MGLMGVPSGDGEDVISITADLIVLFSSLTSMIVYLPSRTINNTLVVWYNTEQVLIQSTQTQISKTRILYEKRPLLFKEGAYCHRSFCWAEEVFVVEI